MIKNEFKEFPRASTGVEGLDHVLGGGFPINRMYLLEGDPGAGKTTLALQFLLAGARAGEPGVYATSRRPRRSCGTSPPPTAGRWTRSPSASCRRPRRASRPTPSTPFHPSEVELSETTRSVLETVERVQPLRVVFDSASRGC
jgi:circadian clock protein KaiC